jgi:hypothetical protein
MGRTALRRAIVVLTAALVLTVAFSPGAHAADAGLTAAMLDTGDLPAGFTPDASLTGPLTGHRAQDLGLSPGQTWSPGTWVRTWRAANGSLVVETAVDAGTGEQARAGAASGLSVLQKQGATRQPVAGFDVYGGLVNQYFELVLPLARGPYLFGLHVLAPASSAGRTADLMSELGAAQVRKVPADTPDTAPAAPVSDAFAAAGAVTGALIGYLLLAGGVGYLRNPLRRTLWRPRSRRVRPSLAGDANDGAGEGAGDGAVDVSAAAKRGRRIAVGRLAVQLAGLGLVAYAADVFQLRFWYAYLVAGLAVVWAGGRFIRPGGADRGRNRAGSHRMLVTVMLMVASAMIVFGLAAIVSFGVYKIQPPGAAVQNLSGHGTTTVQNLATGLEGAGLGLLVLGAVILWFARRLGSAEARRLMLRDPRPPVLYLRSFGDDKLRLRSATFGRPSLIERFTPRRFDRFEEVLVRYLSRYGPVIVVNPPGTRLASLGAARETIEPADRHSAVAGWMAHAALIVFLAPPSQVTQGVHWELRTVAEHGQLDKALVVVPPVSAEQLQARWRAFGAACAGLWPFTVARPLADPRALVLAFRHGRWDVATADTRTEWSYAAALDQALGGPHRMARSVARGARPGARRGPLTLPVAALIVLLAAVMAGAGTWYALTQAPAARAAAVMGAPAPASPSTLAGSGPASSGLAGSGPASAPPASIPPASAPPAGLTSLAPAAALYPGASAIEAVINRYFQAINSRDFAAYQATQSPGVAMTASQFQAGFGSTQDSDVLITGITTMPGGQPAADVTFTSRQQPQDGPEGESCTNWHVTMYFDGSAGTYSIEAPPNGYKAAYRACLSLSDSGVR